MNWLSVVPYVIRCFQCCKFYQGPNFELKRALSNNPYAHMKTASECNHRLALFACATIERPTHQKIRFTYLTKKSTTVLRKAGTSSKLNNFPLKIPKLCLKLLEMVFLMSFSDESFSALMCHILDVQFYSFHMQMFCFFKRQRT